MRSPREHLGKWLFNRDYRERCLASPYDAAWENFVPRNQEEWHQEADLVLEQVAKLIERGLDPTADAAAVTAFLRREAGGGG